MSKKKETHKPRRYPLQIVRDLFDKEIANVVERAFSFHLNKTPEERKIKYAVMQLIPNALGIRSEVDMHYDRDVISGEYSPKTGIEAAEIDIRKQDSYSTIVECLAYYARSKRMQDLNLSEPLSPEYCEKLYSLKANEMLAFIEYVKQQNSELMGRVEEFADQQYRAYLNASEEDIDYALDGAVRQWLNILPGQSAPTDDCKDLLELFEDFREERVSLKNPMFPTEYRRVIKILESIYNGKVLTVNDKEMLKQAPALLDQAKNILKEKLPIQQQVDLGYGDKTKVLLAILDIQIDAINEINAAYQSVGRNLS